MAALTSRSCRAPQAGHVQRRADRLSSASRCPHPEQALDEGYQRPSGSRETITIAGSSAATSTSGQDQTYRSGVAVLASRSIPPRMVNADRV